MKNDVIVAIIIGFVIGAITAVTLVKLPTIVNRNANPIGNLNSESNQTGETQVSQQNNLGLTIQNPADEVILDKNSARIEGTAEKGSYVVLDIKDESLISSLSEDNTFGIDVKLEEGANPIYITAYNENGESQSQTIILYYTNESL